METNYALSLDDPNAHLYEDISNFKALAWSTQGTAPEQSEKKFSVAPCPAYISTLKATRQCPELVYDEVRTVTVQGQRALTHAESAGDYERMQTAQDTIERETSMSSTKQGERSTEPHYESQY